MTPPLRPVVVGVSGVAAAALLLGVVVLGRTMPDALEGEGLPGTPAIAAGLLVVAAQVVVLLSIGRTLRPSVGLVIASGLVPLGALLGMGPALGSTSVAVLVATYVVTLSGDLASTAPALAAAAALVAGGELLRAVADEGLTPAAVVTASTQGVVTVAAAAAVGVLVATRRESREARAAQVRATAGERAALAQAAVSRQRAAMARELHDIAAHHLSGIAVVSAALDRQIDTDPTGAKAAARQVRQQSTAMLRDMRRLVSMLRDESSPTGTGIAVETLGGVPRLVEKAQSSGRRLTLRLEGIEAADLDSADLGPLAHLAAYRTVQEALSNAARHAPTAPCDVSIDATDASELHLRVHNPPGAPAAEHLDGPGFGIIGMQERAELVGATLWTGPTPEGGYAVHLVIPRSDGRTQA